jgi:sulfatase maturation enzyme AslB (radical SAM superfamily)
VNIYKGGCGYFKFLFSGEGKPSKDYFCASYKGLVNLIVDWLRSENIPIKY